MFLLKNKIEALILISPRPLSVKRLASLLETDEESVAKDLSELVNDYAGRRGGIIIAEHEGEVQMVTTAEQAPLVQKFLKDETTGELTRPSLETLTIVAYRGPITRADLEKIRGVNCSIILRNLMMRGLVEAREDKKRLVTFYTISINFLKLLGLKHISGLPDYESLHGAEVLDQFLNQSQEADTE